jgi:hypothetical protein
VTKTLIEALVLLTGGLATLSGVILNWRNRRLSDTQTQVKIGLDEATKSKIVQDAAHSVEQDYLNRLADFRLEISRLNQELNYERDRAGGWRDRMVAIEDYFFTQHMPWDRRMCVVAREHDWVIEDPPSIMEYLKNFQKRINETGSSEFPSHSPPQ